MPEDCSGTPNPCWKYAELKPEIIHFLITLMNVILVLAKVIYNHYITQSYYDHFIVANIHRPRVPIIEFFILIITLINFHSIK